jgi:hypothetical protein
MLVEALGIAGHHQQIPVAEQELPLAGMVISPAQQKAPRRSQAQRGDQRPLAQLRLVVAVPAHAVATIAVSVEQHAVESTLASLLQPFTQRQQRLQPRMRHEIRAGITIERACIAHPAAQPRRIHPAPEHAQAMDFPRYPVVQSEQQCIGLGGREPTRLMAYMDIREICGEQHRLKNYHAGSHLHLPGSA